MRAVYHLELRHFPKRLHRYNLNGVEIGAVVLPWVQEKVVELGEQKWLPQQATITIYEGPEVPVQAISMARGWAAVQRASKDVTDQVLAEAREHLVEVERGGPPATATATAMATAPGGADRAGAVLGDPLTLAVQIGALLGPEGARLLEQWQAVRVRDPGLLPSEALAGAERELADAGP